MTRHELKIVFHVFTLLLFTYCQKTLCSPYTDGARYNVMALQHDVASPNISPSTDPQPEPLHPVNASRMIPFTYNGVPKLSGHCSLNFSAAESILRMTANDCWSPLAPYLADVICCPQLEASLEILLGQSGKQYGKLALNETQAKDCISDVEQILISRGANENLHKICSVHPSNLTESSCPVINVDEIETIIDSTTLLAACEKLDPAIECCNQVCQNAISDAAEKIASRNFSKSNVKITRFLTGNSNPLTDCKRIVIRWLASKLDHSSANKILRGLSSCSINKGCPLDFPDIAKVSGECGNVITNETSCCIAMESYMSSLQYQSFITNLQALNCATSLGMKLQQANISADIYNLCRVNLKEFSLQAESKDSGCLLPSLPSDVTYDNTSGIGFVCDLNDNVGAPWPYGTPAEASSCNKTATEGLPEQPKASSDQNVSGNAGLYDDSTKIYIILASFIILNLFV